MTALYRFSGHQISFTTPGRIEHIEGAYLVQATCSYDHALLMQEHAKADRPVTIFVELGGEIVAVMPVVRLALRERRGSLVAIAAFVHIPSDHPLRL